jgi:hypothetical protein
MKPGARRHFREALFFGLTFYGGRAQGAFERAGFLVSPVD